MGEELKVPRMEPVKKIAKIFGVSIPFVYQKVKSGEVVAVRAGKKFLVNVDKFAEYLNSATVPQTTESISGERLQRIAPISLK